ncbi:MAG TPA: diaminopimelate decarboxylase [Actinomycetota bacterium]|nr:diaminopimelate decarboxylase [Actinomycetota bacterium]
MKDVFPDTARVVDGHLVIAGCDAADLADRFGTPVIVVDRATLEGRAKAFTSVVAPDHIYYAGKAFCCVGILEVVRDLGLSLDVCSGGELTTAVTAGFPTERIIFHGNNKSEVELQMAHEAGVGRIVADSFDELDRIERLGVETDLLLRLTPGVEAHTHEFVQTGQEDSKFGFTLGSGIALDAVRRALEIPGCSLVGVHAHIGSQIFELTAFDLAIERLADFLVAAKERFGLTIREINLGGGLGIAHTRDETTPDPAEAGERLLSTVSSLFAERGLTVPEVFLEPGRALIGSSAVTLYRIGTIKKIPGVRTYVSVDGGMSDNIRPALYGARYEARIATRMDAEEGPRVTVAGKHCESGDLLIRDAHLPEDVAVGDLLVIPATGAYTYAMANNYNRIPRPPVVMVADGAATEIVRRETYNDVLRLDRHADGSPIA